MIDYAAMADILAMDYRAEVEQIDTLERNRKIPVEAVIARRSKMPAKAQAIHIIRVIADNIAIQDLVNRQLESKRGKA